MYTMYDMIYLESIYLENETIYGKKMLVYTVFYTHTQIWARTSVSKS